MKVFGLLVAVFLSGNAWAAGAEKILGVTYSNEGLTYQVTSGGCTGKDDFEFRMLETFPVQVQLIRKTPDFCEAFLPYGVQLSWSWTELGLAADTEFVIGNTLSKGRVYQF